MTPGPKFTDAMRRLSREWKQGGHVLVSGPTQSGKTTIARHLDQIRLDRNGVVVVFVCKLRPDPTILRDYAGWTRWKTWKKRPAPHENRILLWPDTDKAKTLDEALRIQKDVFGHALNELSRVGKWTVHIDEGLYMTHREFLNFSQELAILHAMGASSELTIITLTQRPSHLPLIIYGSASHAFVGRTREASDLKRLSELGGKESAKDMFGRIASQGRHDFLWIPVGPDWDPETVNLRI